MERGTKNFLFSKTRSFPWDASPSPTKGCEVNNLSGGFILAIKQMLVWCGLSKQTKWEEEELSRIWVRASATLYFLHFFLATQHMDDRWIPLLRVAGYYEIKAGQPEYTYYVSTWVRVDGKRLWHTVDGHRDAKRRRQRPEAAPAAVKAMNTDVGSLNIHCRPT